MAMDGITSDGRLFKLYISDPTESRMDYAFTNLAAFLAMAMTDAIEYDTCDEFNDEMVADKYAVNKLADAIIQVMCGDISTENAAHLLLFADTHGLTKLQRALLNFAKHSKKP